MPRTRRVAKTDLPHVIVTDRSVVVTKLRLREGTPISRGPISGLGQVVTTGDTAERQDQRTPQVIWGNQQGGMGEFQYTETEGIESFTDSECDTRYPGMIVLPPRQTLLLGTLSTGTTPENSVRVEYMGELNVRLIAFTQYNPQTNPTSPASPLRYIDGVGWSAFLWQNAAGASTAAPYLVSGYAIYKGYHILGTFGVISALWITYGINGAGPDTFRQSAYACAPLGVVGHDNKLFIWNGTTGRLEWHTDPTLATAWGFSAGPVALQRGEQVTQLIEWRDPSGRAVVYVVTNQRLMQYDEDADVFHTFYNYSQQIAISGFPRAHVWQRDGSLYLIFGTSASDQNTRDTVIWFSGTTNRTGPNARGGLPTTSRASLIGLAGGLHWLYSWASTTPGTTNKGRLYAMNDQQGWHTLALGRLNPDASNNPIAGGGYGRGLAWFVLSNSDVLEIAIPDNTDLPLYATGRQYQTGTVYYHEYAYTDGGTANMDKQALWVTVTSLDHTSAGKVPGLAATCQIVVQYQRDTDNAWTTIGTLTSANTFPAVLSIGSGFGVSFKQIKLRLGLSSSTAANTPVVTSVALAYIRQEDVRYAYTLVADLAAGDHDFYAGLDRVALARRMEGWTQPGQVVSLAFAGGDYTSRPAESTVVPNCTVAFSGQESPESGPGTYTLVFSDISPPSSG